MTHVMITGAAGFLGQRLLKALLQGATLDGRPVTRITLVDIAEPETPEAAPVETDILVGDLADPAFVTRVAATGFDTLFHLASFLTLQAEKDPDMAFRVNVEALRRLVTEVAGCPKVIFASSIAIHGGALPGQVDDDLNPLPTTSYGTHKAINELLLADLSRLGRIDGRSLRLPIVVTRPGSQTPAVSDQIAGILREPLNGRNVTVPLAAGTTVPLASAGAVIAAFLRLHDLPAEALPPKRALNLPALSVTLEELAAAAVRRGAGGRARFAPDPQVQAIVDGWPRRFVSAAATRLGIAPDPDLDALIDDYLRYGHA